MTRALSVLAALVVLLASCGDRRADDEPTTTASTLEGTSTTTTATSSIGNAAGELPARLQPLAQRWDTDFTKSTIDLEELLVGIPAPDPRDLIPPIDDPVFAPVSETVWIEDREPGVLLEMGEDARFYPLAVLTRHEIVNDTMGGIPVAVTYCPLCNTAVTFDRRLNGEVLRLGVSGLLRNSDLVMWDNLTESLWQQITGEAIVGELAGETLEMLPAAIVRWADFRDAHPQGQALSSDQGFGITYGANPYEFYSSQNRPYGFFQGEIDERFPALERVVGVTLETTAKAYPFSIVAEQGVVNDEIGDRPVAIFWGAADTADALDAGDISEAAAVGTAVAFDPVVEGRWLTFQKSGDDSFADVETGTTWSILGRARDGELEGAQLELLPHRNDFWFAWQAFFPEAEVYESQS
jgi:hypothetical protein